MMKKLKNIITAVMMGFFLLLPTAATASENADTVYVTVSSCSEDSTYAAYMAGIQDKVGQMMIGVQGDYAVDLQMGDYGYLYVTQGTDTLAMLPVSTVASNKGFSVMVSTEREESVPLYANAEIGAYGYGTFTSPYAVKIPSGVNNVYLPKLTGTGKSVMLTGTTLLKPGTIIKPYTGVIVKGRGNTTQRLEFCKGRVLESNKAYKILDPCISALEGNAIAVLVADVKKAHKDKEVLTFGRSKTTRKFGFFRYAGDILKPCKAFILK